MNPLHRLYLLPLAAWAVVAILVIATGTLIALTSGLVGRTVLLITIACGWFMVSSLLIGAWLARAADTKWTLEVSSFLKIYADEFRVALIKRKEN